MTQVKDAPSLVVGQIIDTAKRTDADNRQTGLRVTVMVPDDEGGPGFAQINVKLEDAALINFNVPQIAWYVTFSPYDIAEGGRRNTGMSTRFLRVANENDLDRIVSAVQVPAGK